jgi:hypothetical protein
MRAFIRYMLWILAVALPLQGTALAAMSCNPAAMSLHAGVHEAAQHAAHSDHAHCTQSAMDHGGTEGKCSHCASCCVGVAAPPGVPAMPFPEASSTFSGGSAEPSMTSHISAAPERPPRRNF